MRTIGIRELKARLSAVLRDVQDGELVLVTDRGRVVAELRRPGPAAEPSSAIEQALARMAADGDVRLAVRRARDWPATPLRQPAGTARRLLDADRDDG
ncbi:MAG: type II toxin-antitoxin system prevent-host-death family antitoxin [Gemmatimonadales bacterium]|nr:type II toxin-antitoxin system prevent-host-death family antitoxin [Gemmatimonadales bacterium]